ncbi:MAG: ABC transporter ATP-binding protein [Geminicoccaceae bacterium]|nr:ABC transporter ATP-binding protein [Geminicoccaceae bacterium]MDW8342192.1 ABC transporter ATP-binding protein [Geminicoccaceae bacterium]
MRNLAHAYDGLAALGPLDLVVEAGERLAIVGPSGCGKSTLLAILGGLLRPSGGRVWFEGEAPSGSIVPVAYVFQDFALLPWRTVAGNVALPLEGRLPRTEIRARVGAALARTGLSDFAGRFPRELSGGMRQRVGIARALVVEPGVLLLDEPLSALDAQTRELLLEDILGLTEGATLVWVTHNLEEAVRVADRVILLSARPGRIRAEIAVPVPARERNRPEAVPVLARLRGELWALLREDARRAQTEGPP